MLHGEIWSQAEHTQMLDGEIWSRAGHTCLNRNLVADAAHANA